MAAQMHFALTSGGGYRDHALLGKIAHAVQAQIQHDVAPVWNVDAMVCAYRNLADAPEDAYPVFVSDRFNFPSLGVHQDYNGMPLALVKAPRDLSLTISHEIIEMLIDPFGDRTVIGPSWVPGQGDVEYLLEVCDPPEAESYPVNGLPVSDFCTPSYYDVGAGPGVKFSRTGKIAKPLDVLPKGYLSWHEPVEDVWWQWRRFGDGAQQTDDPASSFRLGRLSDDGFSARARVDHMTPRWDAPKSVATRRARHRTSPSLWLKTHTGPARLRRLWRLIDALQKDGYYPPQ